MDRHKVTLLYHKHSGTVKKVSMNGTHSREAAEDVRQQVFLNVFKYIDRFRNECQFKTWLIRLTLNECYQYRLRNWREKRKIAAFLENGTEASHEVGKWDDRIMVQRILALADAETKKSLTLMYVKGMTQEEVAKALQISRVTVTKRLDKFRKTAIAALGEAR